MREKSAFLNEILTYKMIRLVSLELRLFVATNSWIVWQEVSVVIETEINQFCRCLHKIHDFLKQIYQWKFSEKLMLGIKKRFLSSSKSFLILICRAFFSKYFCLIFRIHHGIHKERKKRKEKKSSPINRVTMSFILENSTDPKNTLHSQSVVLI